MRSRARPGIEPHEVRRRNLVRRSRCRSTTSPTSISTAATIPNALRRARRRDRPRGGARAAGAGRAGRPPDRRRHLRSSASRRAHGTSVYAGWGIPMVPGLRAGDGAAHARWRARTARRRALARPGPGDDACAGRARSARHRLRQIKVVHGDTAMTPYSTGTWGSRCMVMAGGAVGDAPARRSPSARQRSARSCCRPMRTM